MMYIAFILILLLLLLLLLIENSSTTTTTLKKISRNIWRINSKIHHEKLQELLYPPLEDNSAKCNDDKMLKIRRNNVVKHPIFNFLHYYYSFSYDELSKYSLGILNQNELTDVTLTDGDVINLKYFDFDSNQYNIKKMLADNNKLGKTYVNDIYKRYEILLNSMSKPPNLKCFGKHEWAMLYNPTFTNRTNHQPLLSLRVNQTIINQVVEDSIIHCTHFDAYRFFQPEAKPLNENNLSRQKQEEYENIACIHYNMDLFKYAYAIYPLCSSELLLNCLELAIYARKVDMLASPYDVQQYIPDMNPINIETIEGKKKYIQEQENIMQKARLLREELLLYYKYITNYIMRKE